MQEARPYADVGELVQRRAGVVDTGQADRRPTVTTSQECSSECPGFDPAADAEQ
jgi:hypothetical protein